MALPTLRINPAVLKWAIAESGWDSKKLAKATDIKYEDIKSWQMQSTRIKLSKLRLISNKIKRPLTVLMLPEPPNEPNIPDLRSVYGVAVNTSKKTRRVIRNVRYVQSIARDILKLRAEEVRPNIKFRSINEDPEVAAEAEKKRLGVSLEKHKGRMDAFARDRYNELKRKIELSNIHVMQASMKINEVWGLALSGRYPCVVLINSKDEDRSRLFTLLHEYAHLLLKSNGRCMPNLSRLPRTVKGPDVSVEKWCNDFAGACIMPKSEILEVVGNRKNEEPQEVVKSLYKKFCASKMAIVIRICNLLDAGTRRDKYIEYHDAIASKPAKERGGWGGAGGRNLAKECVNRNGQRYVKLVLDSENEGLITTSEMIRCLNLKVKHLEKLGAYV